MKERRTPRGWSATDQEWANIKRLADYKHINISALIRLIVLTEYDDLVRRGDLQPAEPKDA